MDWSYSAGGHISILNTEESGALKAGGKLAHATSAAESAEALKVGRGRVSGPEEFKVAT